MCDWDHEVAMSLHSRLSGCWLKLGLMECFWGVAGVGAGILSEASVFRQIIHCTVAPRPGDICVHGGGLRAIAHAVAGREKWSAEPASTQGSRHPLGHIEGRDFNEIQLERSLVSSCTCEDLNQSGCEIWEPGSCVVVLFALG